VFDDNKHGGGALDKSEVPLKDGDMLPGQQGNDACTGCHDEDAANSVWRLAPQRMSFVGKDALALCKQIRKENGLTTGDPAAFDAFLRHLGNDPLIGFAFEGYRGQTANMPDDAQAPPTERGPFIELAKRWLQEGKARCGPWNGSISETISVNRSNQLVEEVSNIQVDIDVKDGDATANVHMTGHQISRGQSCYLRRDDFTVDARDVPLTNFTVFVARDLLNIPGFQVPSLPALPQGAPGAPPIPPPPNILGSDTYSFTAVFAPVTGKTHWEEHAPPGCGSRTGDDPYSLTIPVMQLAKPLDPSNPDHLHDTDTQDSPLGKVTTQWDLTRE